MLVSKPEICLLVRLGIPTVGKRVTESSSPKRNQTSPKDISGSSCLKAHVKQLEKYLGGNSPNQRINAEPRLM